MEKNLIDRAFQLAPESRTITELKSHLQREGFYASEVHQTLVGKQLRSQLTPLLKKTEKPRRVR